MILIDRETFYLKINLENGLYAFCEISGSGKTYLGKTLLSITGNGYRFGYITYDGNKESNDYIYELNKCKGYDVIVVDRYDLYETREINEVLKMLSEQSIVLVDIKHWTEDINCRYVDLILLENGFEIYDNAIRR